MNTRPRPRSAFFGNSAEAIFRVYASGRREKIQELTELYPTVISAENIEQHLDALKNIDVIFSTWGMFAPEERFLDQMSSLKAIFYGAGSVKDFAEPFLKRDIKVVSSWAANAIPVAEFTLAQIILACKRFLQNQQACKDPEIRHHGPKTVGTGLFEEKAALIGAGMIGQKVMEFLKPFSFDVLVVDPCKDDSFFAQKSVVKSSLEQAFREAYVVSNHLPNIPETVGMLDGKLFASMREGATFINTGRGAQVKEDELIAVATERPDLSFVLDVTDPEPPVKDSPLYKLPNVFLSSHIAGSSGKEVLRMADYAIAEFINWNSNKPLRYEISLSEIGRMA